MAAGSSLVREIADDSGFQSELVTAGGKLVVVDFFSTGCNPCKQIAPAFAALSSKYTSAVFLKVNVEVCRNTARRYDVSSMPTFILFKNREKVHQVIGANKEGLESAILQHLDPLDEQDGGGKEEGISIPGQMNLGSMIDRKGTECLNDSDQHPFPHALTSTSAEYLESDCDEQLIISVAFNQPVKLHSLQLTGPSDGRAAKSVKVFINQPNTLDFDQAEQNKPVQEFLLTEEDVLEDASIPLHYVKYQNIQNATIFIRNNQGDEETTVVHHLAFYGSPLDVTKMSEFKRVAGEKGERHS